MIVRGEFRPSGFVVYTCSLCHAEWQVHVHEDPAVVTAHSDEECSAEIVASAELKELQKKHPNRRFARSALDGKWVPL
jgi:hypothetical protein